MPLVACYGGTFDPVHRGHLQAARDVLELLGCREVRLIPCRLPPHRDAPAAGAVHRLAMLQRAVADVPGLVVDARELERDGPSYTVDTLASLRAELGPDVAIGWVMGTDALAALDSWREWRRLPELAHLLLLDRPGSPVPETGPVAELLRARMADGPERLHRQAAGLAWRVGQRPLTISATEVRAAVASGRSTSHLLPVPVWAYIKQEHLYGYRSGSGHDAENE